MFPFPTDPELQAIAIAYRNPAYIADLVLPRVPVGKREFKFNRFPIEEAFALPDTKVGRKSRPNQVDLTAEETPSAVEDYGLDDPIPIDDIDNAPKNYNPKGHAVQQLTDYILLDREVRTAALVFNAANYDPSLVLPLSGTDQFSDYGNSNPIEVLKEALDKPLMRPNQITMGQAVWTKVSMHPDVVKAAHGNSGDKGVARREAVADILEVNAIHVGQSRLNVAKKGQTASLARVWGKHISMTYIDPNADTKKGLTFGYTAEYGERVSGEMEDKNIGLRGGVVVRVGESVKELIAAPSAGYLILNAVG